MAESQFLVLTAQSDDGDDDDYLINIPTRIPRLDRDIPGPASSAPGAASPVVEIRTTRAADGGQKPLWLLAHIRPHHLGTGQTTDANRPLANRIADRGYSSRNNKNGHERDDCGHVVGNQVGGKMVECNLFPQDMRLNRGWTGNYRLWKIVDALIYDWLEMIPLNCNPNVEYQMRLYYHNREKPDRPTHFKYAVGLFRGIGDEKNQAGCGLTQEIFNLSAQLLKKVNEANIEKFKKEVKRCIGEAKVGNTQKHQRFVAKFLYLVNGAPESGGTDDSQYAKPGSSRGRPTSVGSASTSASEDEGLASITSGVAGMLRKK